MHHYIFFQAIGIFLAGCFLFTFMSLMEYSLASFLGRRYQTFPKITKIDHYSRYVFPSAFCTFQMVYWIVCFTSIVSFPHDMIHFQR